MADVPGSPQKPICYSNDLISIVLMIINKYVSFRIFHFLKHETYIIRYLLQLDIVLNGTESITLILNYFVKEFKYINIFLSTLIFTSAERIECIFCKNAPLPRYWIL